MSIPYIIVFLFSLTGHEWAHARVATNLGDPTPRQEGRLTWNVFSHISLPGMLMFYLTNIGWAKPVRVDTRYLRNPQTDMLWISLAGPLTNLVIALCAAIIWHFALPVWPEWALQTLFIAIYLNIMLAFFNLLPIPPLDGSKIFTSFLPTRWSYLLQQIEPWGFIILLVSLNYLGLGTFLGKLSDIIVRWLLMW